MAITWNCSGITTYGSTRFIGFVPVEPLILEENVLYNYLNMIDDLKMEKLKEQMVRNSIMLLEIKGD